MYWYQLTASWVEYLTTVHNHTALKSMTVNWNGCGKKQFWLILRDRKARKTLTEYECQLFNYKYTDPTLEVSKAGYNRLSM